MSADIEKWRESVQQRAMALQDAISSNENRLAPGQVDAAKNFICQALVVVGCSETAS